MSAINNNNNNNNNNQNNSHSTQRRLPRCEQLPEPIYSTTPGTWAYDTMSRRVDAEILERTWQDNQEFWLSLSSNNEGADSIVRRFQDLRQELRHAATTPLTYLEDVPETTTSSSNDEITQARIKEQHEWRQILRPYVEKKDTWLSAPWAVAEFYLYRRLLQVTGYFDPSSPGYRVDPFARSKHTGLTSSVGSAEPMLAKLRELPTTTKDNNDDKTESTSLRDSIKLVVGMALWGNQMDLSLWPADASHADQDVFSKVLAAATENLLHDDTDELTAHCQNLLNNNNNNNDNDSNGSGARVDIIVDNAGFELVTDLALAHYLIRSGVARTVTFQLKSHPTFVSDAMEKDLLATIQHYEQLDASKYPHARAAGEQWREYLRRGQWTCREDNFWVQPSAMWDMPTALRTDLHERCDLVFVKGDANYRRLLGNLHWDYTTPFVDVVSAYFPCPVCALRTLKAEVGCGMDADQIERAKKLDKKWEVNGKFGVIQFGKGTGKWSSSSS